VLNLAKFKRLHCNFFDVNRKKTGEVGFVCWSDRADRLDIRGIWETVVIRCCHTSTTCPSHHFCWRTLGVTL